MNLLFWLFGCSLLTAASTIPLNFLLLADVVLTVNHVADVRRGVKILLLREECLMGVERCSKRAEGCSKRVDNR